MEDSDIVTDLRHKNSGSKTKFDIFWEQCRKFFGQQVSTAVDDIRHSNVTHLATAISVQDLKDQVAAQCTESTPVRSVEWLRLLPWLKLPPPRHLFTILGALTYVFGYSKANGERTATQIPIMLLESSAKSEIRSPDERVQFVFLP